MAWRRPAQQPVQLRGRRRSWSVEAAAAVIHQISDQLEHYGYDRLGEETLYNGMTGTELKPKG